LAGSRLGTAATSEAGTPIAVTPPAGTEAHVTVPGGEARILEPGLLEFTATEAPGVYRIDYLDDEGAVVGGFVTSRRFSAAEAAGTSRLIAVAEPEAASLEESSLVREWAPAIIAALLALVLLEWWVAFGRPRPRRRADVRRGSGVTGPA
jgi:hypothetical protein